MNPYIVEAIGQWPNEKYIINIDKNVLDNRYSTIPIEPIFSPYYVEDNNYVERNYENNVRFNDLLQLSSNRPYIFDSGTGEINVNLLNNVTFSWTPSAFRKGNYGNIFGSLMLRTDDNTHYGLVIHPSQLFLYPTNVEVLTEFQKVTSDLFFATLSTTTDLNNLFSSIQSISVGLSSNLLENPLISSFYFVLTSYVSYQTTNIDDWIYQTTFLNFNNLLNFTSSINLEVSSYFAYEKLSGSELFLDLNSYTNFVSSTLNLNNFYSSYTIFDNLTSLTYNVLYEIPTDSYTYILQTSTVLLSSTTFQFIDDLYAEIIKTNNNFYLSQIPVNFLPFDNTNITNLKYGLSANITRCNREIIKFTESYNPIYFSTLLEDSDANIKPDTVKLGYIIQFLDTEKNIIRTIGDEYDDFSINPDKVLESSYIFNHDNINKILTFQLLQSAIYPNEPLETINNCVLTAILNFDSCLFTYRNVSNVVDLDSLNFYYTPISGVPNTALSIRYMADLPYISKTESLNSSVCSISSPNSFDIVLNNPIPISTHNNTVNWHLKYPPYYYSFKNSYSNSSFDYENINSLNFYLSSEVIRKIERLSSDDFFTHVSEADLYTSFYSDFDVIEIPLKIYGHNDYIKYTLENKSEFLDLNRLKAYVLSSNSKNEIENSTILEEYDIVNSPYIPAVSGSYLKLIYELYNGGTVLTIKPSVSTKFGVIDSYWATTFSMGLDYIPRNSVRPVKIQTLSQNITSTVLSIAGLTSNDSGFGLDLTSSQIAWNVESDDINNLTIKNVTPVNVGAFENINNYEVYPYDFVNQIEITGITNKTYTVTVTSYLYGSVNSTEVLPTYFDRFAENKLFIENFNIDTKNKIKLLKLNCKTPVYNSLYDIRPESTILWKWGYNNILDVTPVSAYLNNNDINVNDLENFLNLIKSNQFISYKESTVSFGDIASSIYILVDTDYTLTEEFFPLSVDVEVYDTGEILYGNKIIEINSYPDFSIFSTNFQIFYPNFQTIPVLDTQTGISSMTRPPNNGTNYYALVATTLNSQNASISSLFWKIDKIVTPLSSLNSPYYGSEIINLSLNSSGVYDPLIYKDFNNYIFETNTYLNMEYIDNSTSKVLNQTNVDLLCSTLSFNNLSLISSVLLSFSSNENAFPLATSLNVITTAFYTQVFETANEYSFVNELTSLYSAVFYTSTVRIEEIEEVDVDIFENVITEYDLFCVDYYLSSNNFVQTDDSTIINNFITNNISTQTNVLTTFTTTNKTTSFEYTLLEQEISQNLAYYEYDITLAAKNVSILNWSNFYNFETKGKLIIPTKKEFETYPILYNVPKFIWLPTSDSLNYKKSNRYVNIIDSFDTQKPQLTGKTYGNSVECEKCLINVQSVQEFQISENDPIELVFAVGNNQLTFLRNQVISEPDEYEVYAGDIRIKDFQLPCLPDLYEPEGMHLSVTAFNRFFPPNGGISYFGLKELSSTELSLFYYPITAQTYDRSYDSNGLLIGNYVNANPKLFEYEPAKLLFYPEVKNIDLDTKRIIKVKQIIEIDPINSPNLIEFEKSTVIYTLHSNFWSVSTIVAATSNSYVDLFTLNVGDPSIPLTISDYEIGSLTLTASAYISTKITSGTFNNYSSSQYTGNRDLWESVYQFVIGNNEQPSYKILFSEVNTITSGTETISTYNILSNENDYIITI
jgi:hypothetical protein